MKSLSWDRYLRGMFRADLTSPSQILSEYAGRKAAMIYQPKVDERLSRIDTSPGLILDCPGLLDDFYLHILDWSLSNMISVALDRKVYSYNYTTKAVLPMICSTEDSGYVSAVRSFEKGSKLAVAQCKGCVVIIDFETTSKMRQFMVEDKCRAPVIAGDNNLSHSTILLGTSTGNILAYDLRGKCHTPSHTISAHVSEVCGLEASGHNGLVASGGSDNQLLIWDPRMWRPVFQIKEHIAAVRALSWCPWRRGLLASGGGQGDRTLKVWNTSTGCELYSKDCGSQISNCFWLEHEANLITTHGFDTKDFALWAYPELDRLTSIKAHDSRVLQAALSPNGTLLATAAANENMKIWTIS